MSSLSSQVVVDDELMEYEVGKTNHDGGMFGRNKGVHPPTRDFQVIHDCPRPKSMALYLPSVPFVPALPVGIPVESSSKQYLNKNTCVSHVHLLGERCHIHM